MTHQRFQIAGTALVMILSFANLANGQELRAAYVSEAGESWSAMVELPSFDLLTIGPDTIPLAVNDKGTVLLRDASNRLIRWTWGRSTVLQETFTPSLRACLNEAGTIVATYSPEVTNRILFWYPGQDTPGILDWGNSMIAEPYFTDLFGLNDRDQLVLRSDASTGLFILPETNHIETNTAVLPGHSWNQLSQYEYTRDVDFSSRQGGQIYRVYGFNNYADTVGLILEEETSSDAPDDTFDLKYFTYNQQYTLEFEPLAINDAGTILGQSADPGGELVILDRFGQRTIGAVPLTPQPETISMSNPDNGLEEIVHGRTYYRRMSERDLHGNPTGQPSPDFWKGYIQDLIRDDSGWTTIESTCISANGRIAGTGWRFDPDTGTYRNHAWVAVGPMLIPDWDRNGKIDDLDRSFCQRDLPWRFWINDDNDSGDLAESATDDLPESGTPDWESTGIDGLRDVVDFFPLHIDLQQIFNSLGGTTGVEVRLKHADGALNIAYTQLDPLATGDLYTRPLPTGFGPFFNDPVAGATTERITSNGILLNRQFLENLHQNGRGVLLVEASQATTKPVIMEVVIDGHLVLSSSLPLSISPVRDMLRILNLRQADPKFAADPGPWETRMNEPPNLPDDHLAALHSPIRTLVHIHGFNWTGEEIPAAHAEVFKRFYQAGSSARFIGVTWRGDAGTLDLTNSSFEYNENVIHAFITAKYLTEQLHSFSGPGTSIFAHSLGNMVASSSIVDFSLRAGNYFMINAAVPMEAYVGETADRRHMVHPEWKSEADFSRDYAGFLLSPNWYRLFPADDHRSFLTWKNRFGNIHEATRCYNFYSSGEDVLKTGNGDIPSLLGDVVNKEWVWVFNEMVKGTNTFSAHLAGDVHGGWGFNRFYMDWVDPGGAAHPPPGDWVPMPPSEAATLDPQQLVQEPFFHRFSSGDKAFSSWEDGAWLYQDTNIANQHLPIVPFGSAPMESIQNHAKLLAEGIPAHSAPTGSQPLHTLYLLDNVDLDKTVRDHQYWPDREDVSRRDRWLHSDYLYPAFPQVFGLYRLCVNHIHKLP